VLPKSEYQKSLAREALHELRVQIRKFRAVLKLSAPLFEAEKRGEILKLLAEFMSRTNQLRDLHVFAEFLKADDAPASFLQQLNLIAKRSEDKILEFYFVIRKAHRKSPLKATTKSLSNYLRLLRIYDGSS